MLILPPKIVSMGSVVDGCEIDFDSTIYDSYIGSGESLVNIEPRPASGAAQSAYDMYLGAAGTTDGDEPTFNGTAGNADAYFSFDGNDFFLLQGSNTTFVNNIHNTTSQQDFTVVMPMFYTNATQILFGNRVAGGTNIGCAGFTLAGDNKLYFTQRGDTAAVTSNSASALSTNAINFIAIGFSHSSNQTSFWINNKTAETAAHTFNATTVAASGALSIGAYSNGGSSMATGQRLYSFSMFDHVLSNDEMEAAIRQYEIRHNRSYI